MLKRVMQSLLCGVTTCFLLSAQAAPESLLVLGLENSATWLGQKDSKTEVSLPLRFKSKVKPIALIVGQDHPNSTKFLVLFDQVAIPLPVNFADSSAFGESGNIENGYRIQFGEHDFNHDGQPEIVIAVGDGLVNLAINVFYYFPPANPSDAARLSNWKLVGRFSGQSNAIVKKDRIKLPFGSQGLLDEYTWISKGYFVHTN
jgi:hypothetical protein